MKRFLKITLHVLLFLFLTVITQIGGLIYLLVIALTRKNESRRRLKRAGLFLILYLTATFLLVPLLAPLTGREKIEDSSKLEAHSFFYKLANRNYVRPELHEALIRISHDFESKHPGIKLIYLDANFPFLDRFPLLPHLSHNDGKKIDISLIYVQRAGELCNHKKSFSGYGVYEGPLEKEYDQIKICKQKGNWQYDFPKYLTFGTIHPEINFSEEGTRDLIDILLNEKNAEKLFIEPHLKSRLKLTNSKVRYHGCHAVRHDDHIHFQLR